MVDYLRSCYSTTAKLIEGSDHESPIVWYWADPAAGEVQNHHAFGSLNWWQNNSFVQTGPGEVPGAPRPWRDGTIPTPYPAMVRDGTEREWVNGADLGNGPIARSEFGIPIACLPWGTLPGPYAEHTWTLATSGSPATVVAIWVDFEWVFIGDVSGDTWRLSVNTSNIPPGDAPVHLVIEFDTLSGIYTSTYSGTILSTAPYKVKFSRVSGMYGPAIVDGDYLPYP